MKMRKLVSVLLVTIMLFSALAIFAGCTPREDTLKILNWAEYIDRSLLDDFKDYIADTEDGRKIKISYSEAETNEEMYAKVKEGKRDFDLLCPSDYMIEKMIKENLLNKIDLGIVFPEDEGGDRTSVYVKGLYDQFTDIAMDEYTVGYTWGTMGIIYDPARVNALLPAGAPVDADGLVKSWNALWAQYPGTDRTSIPGGLKDGKNNTITFKNSIRDNYFTANVYLNGPITTVGEANNTSNISAIGTALTNQKKVAKYWEVDRLRDEIFVEKKGVVMGLQWAGDAKYSIDEAAKKGITLKYYVPDDGSNVFFDGWVMPIYGKQAGDLAEKFLYFISRPENAIQNMTEIGYTSVIADEDLIRTNFHDATANSVEVDLSYFFGKPVKMNVSQVYYPTKETLLRCFVMKNFDDNSYKDINDMWNSLR